MALRLLIGTAIIDADRTGGNTSTIAGARLLLPKDGLNIAEDDLSSEFTVFCFFDGLADTAALKTSMEALKVAVADNINNDVTFEFDAGSTLREFLTSSGDFFKIKGKVDVEYGKKTALAKITIRAERQGPPITVGGNLPAGASSASEWQYEQTVSGIAAAISTHHFKKLADAKAYVTIVRGGTTIFNIPASFRITNIQHDYEESDSASSPTVEDDLRPSVVRVIYKELSENYAGNSAFDNVKSVTAFFSADPQLLDDKSSALPGLFVSLIGSMEFKTEGNTSFDSGDTTQTAEGVLLSQAEDAFDVIKSVCETRLAEGTWQTLKRIVQMSGEHGTVEFTFEGYAGVVNGVLSWEEDVTIIKNDRSEKVYSSKGKSRRYDHPAGDQVIIEQDATIEALAVARNPGRPLGVDNTWNRLQSRFTTKRLRRAFNGEDIYRTKASGAWEKDERGGGKPRDDRTTIAKKA